MSDEIFYDPAVLRVIRSILVSKGIRADPDLQDAISEVVVACIAHTRASGHSPETVDEAIPLARDIAHKHGVSGARKRVRRGKSNVGLTAEADEHAPRPRPSLDKVDERRMLSVVYQSLNKDQIEALSDVGAGVKQSELAAERNASDATMRKRTQAARAKALGALSAKGYVIVGGFAALLAGAIAVRFGLWRNSDVVTNGRDRSNLDAMELRHDAIVGCSEERWDICEEMLDRAARLDPKGEEEQDVKALRSAIAVGRAEAGAAKAEAGADAR